MKKKARNRGRLGKNLWTEGRQGEPIRIYAAFNELDEARFVVERIEAWLAQGNPRRSVALLYRANAQSRVLEEALLRARMPYRVYGGLRFFERAEIKDALGYLRLLANRHDDTGFERVVNTPTRGIGERTLEQVRGYARAQGCSLWSATAALLAAGSLGSRASNALRGFTELIDRLAAESASLALHEQVEQALQQSGLLERLEREPAEKAQARLENLNELVSAARECIDEAEESEDALTGFLAHAALESGERQADAFEDCVQLMTLHSAKGLEFPLVFLCGMEEGLFPHQMSVNDPKRLEEERRLCYVGMTRAMRQLYFCYAEQRRLHGRDNFGAPSRFITELPREYLEEVRLRGSVSIPLSRRHVEEPGAQAFALGQRVNHPKFGEGVVLNWEGQGDQARVQVNFQAVGSKWLVAAYARLQAV